MRYVFQPVDQAGLDLLAAHMGQWVRRHISFAPGCIAVLALRGGVPAGFLSMRFHAGAPGQAPFAEVEMVAVDPFRARAGLRRRLLRMAADHAGVQGLVPERPGRLRDRPYTAAMWHAADGGLLAPHDYRSFADSLARPARPLRFVVPGRRPR